ncbi:NAD(P)-binding protein [Aspergillus sclerotiicarbonarius CBS 121057]|uniref:NAD(P)-binding protein n=1 Tax=Aspergillus sclerotiicarbonarius (strain CBS 121057 / IBT 28362) TaxID=1448318 RepID=A0A319EBJ8_ASPSB|nr:NAD(P)-binding protein [Aspergillus sclerotiicarbonarius CBS 121057]
MSLFSLAGKTALVTGGTRGIGQAIALGLAEHGADIILSQRSSNPTTDTRSAIEQLGRRCDIVHCDLADRAQVEALIPGLTPRQSIDILINAAGIQIRRAATEYDLDTYDTVVQTNLTAPFILARDLARHWLAHGHRGKVINVASISSFQGGVNMAGYSASKGGVLQLTKAFSNEWAAQGVNVNAIAPGYIATDMNVDTRTNPEAREYLQSITERIPAGRWGTPDDLKGAAVFLASRASDYIHGEVIVVDGGWMGR